VTVAVAVEPLPLLRTIRAAADVIEVEDGLGFCASVLVVPGAPSVARLARSLTGAASEGRVLREVMVTTAGVYGPGLFVWRQDAVPAVPEGATPLLRGDECRRNRG
jgi:hypothetical protein